MILFLIIYDGSLGDNEIKKQLHNRMISILDTSSFIELYVSIKKMQEGKEKDTTIEVFTNLCKDIRETTMRFDRVYDEETSDHQLKARFHNRMIDILYKNKHTKLGISIKKLFISIRKMVMRGVL